MSRTQNTSKINHTIAPSSFLNLFCFICQASAMVKGILDLDVKLRDTLLATAAGYGAVYTARPRQRTSEMLAGRWWLPPGRWR